MHTEVLIIGAGVGGMTLAHALAAKGKSVCLIDTSVDTISSVDKFSAREIVRRYKNSGFQIAYGHPLVAIGEGIGPGGGGAVNASLIQRPSQEILDSFVDLFKIEAWDPGLREKYFSEAEALLSLKIPNPGTRGRVMEAGAERLKWKYTWVPQAENSNMATLLLGEFGQYGGRLFTGSIRSIKKNLGAWKVNLEESTGEKRVFSADRLVLAGGAIESPKILNLFVRGKFMARAKFKAHLFSKFIATFPMPIEKEKALDMIQIKEFSPNLSMGCSAQNEFLLKLYFSAKMSWEFLNSLKTEKMGLFYSMTRTKNHFVNVHSRLGGDSLLSNLSKEDMQNSIRGSGQLVKLLRASGAETIVLSDGRKVSEDEIQKLRIGELSLSTVHLFSSLPISGNRDSVMDSFGKVLEHKNLFVCDASLIPDCPGVNPQLLVMSLARRLADNWE